MAQEQPWEKFDETNPRTTPPAFDFKHWLSQHTFWEDAESLKQFYINEEGNFAISDWEGYCDGEGKTLEEACLNFCENNKCYPNVCDYVKK